MHNITSLRTMFFILAATNGSNLTRQILIVCYYLGLHLPDGLYFSQVIQPKFCVHLSLIHAGLFYMYRLYCHSSCNRLTDFYFGHSLWSQAFLFLQIPMCMKLVQCPPSAEGIKYGIYSVSPLGRTSFESVIVARNLHI